MDNITLEINGESRSIPPVSNILDLLRFLEIAEKYVAVELNRKIIRRQDWEHTPISDQDKEEIVQFVGGG